MGRIGGELGENFGGGVILSSYVPRVQRMGELAAEMDAGCHLNGDGAYY